MPRITMTRLAAACALASVLLLSITAGAAAKRFPGQLRVVGKGNKVLAEQAVRTGAAVSVKASPKAICFGAKDKGSGKAVSIPPNSAMGLLATASKSISALRPLRITDAFSFGLGLCGVGSSIAKGGASWYLKVNHKGALVSGDHVTLRPEDEVLWDLAPSYPYPNELTLEAPRTVSAGVPFTVKVVSYDEKGKKKPVAGALVTNAAGPTAADGTATVALTASGVLTATHGKEIPSAAISVCAATPAAPCPVA